MDQATTTAITQLGLSAIFAIACVQLFLRLEKKDALMVQYLIETISAMRQQNTVLMEQNRQLSVALFANNPDAQRAYTAMAKTQQVYTNVPSPITDLNP